MLIKTKKICHILVEMYQLLTNQNRCSFPDPLGRTSEKKTRSLVETVLFIALEKVIYNRMYLIKLLPKLLFLHM